MYISYLLQSTINFFGSSKSVVLGGDESTKDLLVHTYLVCVCCQQCVSLSLTLSFSRLDARRFLWFLVRFSNQLFELAPYISLHMPLCAVCATPVTNTFQFMGPRARSSKQSTAAVVRSADGTDVEALGVLSLIVLCPCGAERVVSRVVYMRVAHSRRSRGAHLALTWARPRR